MYEAGACQGARGLDCEALQPCGCQSWFDHFVSSAGYALGIFDQRSVHSIHRSSILIRTLGLSPACAFPQHAPVEESPSCKREVCSFLVYIYYDSHTYLRVVYVRVYVVYVRIYEAGDYQGTRVVDCESHLTQCFSSMVLKSQLPHKIVNLLHSKLIENNKLTIL